MRIGLANQVAQESRIRLGLIYWRSISSVSVYSAQAELADLVTYLAGMKAESPMAEKFIDACFASRARIAATWSSLKLEDI